MSVSGDELGALTTGPSASLRANLTIEQADELAELLTDGLVDQRATEVVVLREDSGTNSAQILDARALAERIFGLDDPDLRCGRLAMLLHQLEPDLVTDAIETAATHVHDPVWRVLYLTWTQVLLIVRQRPNLPAGPLRAEHERVWPNALALARWTGSASRNNRRFCIGLLRGALQPPGRHDAKPLPPPVAIEHLPLGLRRERARGPKRELLVQLLVDTDPSVVELLARNPRLRQADIMRLATNRRTHPWALWSLMLAQRWLSDRGIPLAIAHNPVCPPWLLVALAPLLEATQLGDALRKRPLLGAEVLQPLAVLHGGALRTWIEARLAQLALGDDDGVVAIDTDIADAGDALASVFAELVASVGDDPDAAFVADGDQDGIPPGDDAWPDDDVWPEDDALADDDAWTDDVTSSDDNRSADAGDAEGASRDGP